jgi:hypothetical protein
MCTNHVELSVWDIAVPFRPHYHGIVVYQCLNSLSRKFTGAFVKTLRRFSNWLREFFRATTNLPVLVHYPYPKAYP